MGKHRAVRACALRRTSSATTWARPRYPRGNTDEDALRALGFVHAQERYFEMDLLRRSAAGELAGLFGTVALSQRPR
jgi:hypothetical protein